MQRTFSPRTRLTSVCALSLALACGTGGAALAQDHTGPVTLRLAIADDAARPTYPIVEALIGAASELSDGAVTIQPIFDAAGGGFEIGTAKLLLDGAADLAIVAGRSWDQVGVDAFKALQAPYLIDNDALAEAIADSDAARAMLDSVAGDGLVGLELWPEDLRHPAAFPGCAEPLVAPEDFAGLGVRAAPSDVTYDLLETLGASPTFVEWDEDGPCTLQATESGLLQGRSLPPGVTFTGDVTFFPKFQVLAANAAVFERLSDAQREVIRQAAAVAQDLAIDTHPTDAQAAAELCAAGHRVVLAGPEGVAAFQAAARPVYERLAADPVAAEAIAAITALKDTLEPALGAIDCDPAFAEVAPFEAATDPSPSDGAIPDGIYEVTLTKEDAERTGWLVDDCAMDDRQKTVALEISGARWTERQACDDGPREVGSFGTLRYEGDRVIFTETGFPGHVAFAWQYDGEVLSLRLLETEPDHMDTAVLRFLFENDFTKVPDLTVAAIPDGSYSATRTKEDALRIGWGHDVCVDLRDGRDMTVTLEVGGTDWVESNTCADGVLDVGSHGTLRYEDDRVIFTEPGLPGHVAYAWQYEGNALSLRLLEVEPDLGDTEVLRVLFENDFTRAADD